MFRCSHVLTAALLGLLSSAAGAVVSASAYGQVSSSVLVAGAVEPAGHGGEGHGGEGHGGEGHGGEGHDRETHGEHRMEDHHGHGTIEVPAGSEAPAITALSLTEDSVSGWNLQIQVENFQFVPQEIGQTNIPNEGHAHLYINGEKVARLYGPFFHISDLPMGEHRIVVTLNTNQHAEIQHDGKLAMIADTVVVP